VNLLTQYVSGTFCSKCYKLVPSGKKCVCGNKNLSPVAGKWNEVKEGWDYFDLKGRLVGCVLIKKTTNKVVKTNKNIDCKKPKIYIQLSLFN